VIPGWPPSLLITPLKDDKIYRLKLLPNGTVLGDTVSYFRGDGNRIRRIISDPSGLKFYVARDNQTITEYTYTGITLPVELLFFKGALQNNVAVLDWATSSEINTSRFVVERSIDGVTYHDIATIPAGGNNSSRLNYTYTDQHAINQQAEVVYYRVRMIDIDEQYKYSTIVTISLKNKLQSVIVSPNPVTGITKLTITVPNYSSAQWMLVENAGSTVMQSSLQLAPGVNSMPLNLSQLAAGVYYLKISGPGISQNIKLQKL